MPIRACYETKHAIQASYPRSIEIGDASYTRIHKILVLTENVYEYLYVYTYTGFAFVAGPRSLLLLAGLLARWQACWLTAC